MKNKIKKLAMLVVALVLCTTGCTDLNQFAGMPSPPTISALPTYTPIRTPKNSQTAKPTAKPGKTATAKPSATVKPATGGRVPLDTTGQYSGLRLKRYSDRNDFTARDINGNENQISRLTGAEPEFKAAVEQFEIYKKKNSKAVAYKALGYFELGDKELNLLNKSLAKQKKTATDYYRIILEVYQYEPTEAKKTPYTDTDPDPYYFIAVVYKTTDGEYTATYATKQ